MIADTRFSPAVEETVRDIEAKTGAEIIVVAAGRSGSYRDLAILFGAAAAWAAGAFLVFSPFPFAPYWIPLELPLVGFVVGWAVHRSPWLLCRLASKERMRKQVRSAARAAFHEQAVHGTRGRTGILVYLSLLEEEVVLLPDAQIEARIAGGTWNAISWGHDLTTFLAGLRAVGRVLQEAFPPAAENPNEIPDAPRIVP